MSEKSRLLKANADLYDYPLAVLELERRDWTSLRCGCGRDAAHVRDAVASLLAGGGDGSGLVDHLGGGDAGLAAPAAPVAAVLVNALSDGAEGGVLDEIAFVLLFLADAVRGAGAVSPEGAAFLRVLNEGYYTVRAMGAGAYAEEAETILGLLPG
ncbi:hypothetical protein [Actinomadura sp. WAC 06369]|uniref:hypothetical protein n=1 Tax=Actinomadura sp. WAC 06369 TaxID=2203193 RepID=UPI000F78E372|nr:hypothetical protein [Actinomadura sp. WAC 06369]RSN55771.1 hypothetical protein DMH08_25650 [Actinomadura sp. WAC 06369]